MGGYLFGVRCKANRQLRLQDNDYNGSSIKITEEVAG